MLLKRSTPQLTFERGNLEPKWNIGTKMEHFERQNSTPHDTAEKKQKKAETLENLGFPPLSFHERAGIRTPDNLIKSQVLELYLTPAE